MKLKTKTDDAVDLANFFPLPVGGKKSIAKLEARAKALGQNPANVSHTV
jgi:hypothetical protein